MWFFPSNNLDFDISTIGDERTKHATQMYASSNFFENKEDPQRSSKDDLESLVYTMWSIAGIKRDPYQGRSGLVETPEGLSLFASLNAGEGGTARLVVRN